MSVATAKAPAVVESPFLTIGETSEELGLTRKQLLELRRSGGGPKFMAITRTTIYYFRAEVLDWKQEQSRSQAA